MANAELLTGETKAPLLRARIPIDIGLAREDYISLTHSALERLMPMPGRTFEYKNEFGAYVPADAEEMLVKVANFLGPLWDTTHSIYDSRFLTKTQILWRRVLNPVSRFSSSADIEVMYTTHLGDGPRYFENGRWSFTQQKGRHDEAAVLSIGQLKK